MLQSEKDYHGCWVPGSVSTVHFWNPKCRKNMQTYRYIGHLLVMIWNILKELLKHCIFVQNISLLQSFSFFNFTYIIHKAKEYNNGTNKISWSFSLDFICPAICACVWYVYVCMRVDACVGVHCTCVSVCYFFRTVNRMKHLEIPLHILVLEFEPENILMPFK